MANKAEFIQLENGDDAASVRDRLSFIRGQQVLLIWPEEGTILMRKLDLVLIQREAMRRSIRLALVTHDPQVVQHANELNISTFETIGASERGRWRRGRSKVFTSRSQRPEDEPIPDDLKEVASRIYAEESAIQKRWRRVQRVILGIVLLVLVGGLSYVFLPSATVQMTPAKGQVTGATEIVADPLLTSVDVENRTIPATKLSVQVEDTGTIETTGAQNLGDAPATGSVVFINQGNREIVIPADSTVITSAGIPIQFRTTQEATLAAGIGFQVEVPIEALPTSAGEVGNVDSGVINTVVGPLATDVTVRNLSPTSGGASQSQKAVDASDKDRLLETVRQQLQARAYVEMEPRLTATQFIILETVHIAEERSDWMTYSANVGDVTDTLSLTMRVVVEATAVDQQFGQQLVYAQMSSQVRQGQFGKAVEIRPESVTYERGAVSGVDSTTGKVTFAMTGTGTVSTTIDPEQVRQQLAGRSINDAIAHLVSEYNLQQGTTPLISVSPDWFGNMPLLPMRIDVLLQDAPA
jgi:hypothetical protein